MTKVSRRKLSPEELAQIREDLHAALTLLENKREVRNFLKRFWTPTERVMFAKRFQLIMMLVDRRPYEQIQEVLHMSPDTISKFASKLEEEENRVLIQIAQKILDLREEIELQRRNELQKKRRHVPGDLATPLAAEGIKRLSGAWFTKKKQKSTTSA